jgi:hypothetical protein
MLPLATLLTQFPGANRTEDSGIKIAPRDAPARAAKLLTPVRASSEQKKKARG